MTKILKIKTCNNCPYKSDINKSLIKVGSENTNNTYLYYVRCNLVGKDIKLFDSLLSNDLSYPPGYFDNIKIPNFCPLKDKKSFCKKNKKNKPNKFLKKAVKFYNKANKHIKLREDIIKYKVDKLYVYRLRNPENKNLQTYEIGVVENPWKYDINYKFNWNDVNSRCCEGFWGDRPLVEDFVYSMNVNIVNKKKNE